jgi:hypothetical protein
MPKKLFITNQRMLDLMAWAIENGIAQHESAFFRMIKFPRTNISNIRSGALSFTREHIMNACKITGASADYIFGFTNSMLRKDPVKPIDQLKQAVKTVELELLMK